MRSLRIDAPAKLNLGLTVVGRREDGYHLIESTLVLLELADRLLLLPGATGLRVEGAGADVPAGRDNLAWRGLVAGLGREPSDACLVLEKRVPSAAGLGGGSSDAAAAWRLGREAEGPHGGASERELLELASIGADVPFFAAAVAAARVRGIGELVARLEPIERHVVLVHPPFGLPTAAVFAELHPDEWGRGRNDLLAPALRLRPELGSIIDALSDAGVEPLMSGSGPTVYALVEDGEHAQAVAQRVVAAGLHATMTRTRTAAAAIEPIDEEDG